MERKPSCWPYDEFKNKEIVIDLVEGRKIEGILRGHDNVGNLVMADCIEIRPSKYPPHDFSPRKLGVVVVIGSHIISIDLK